MPKRPKGGPLRLLLDTNVVVAGLPWNGAPRRLMEYAFSGNSVELYSSPALLKELRQTLSYPKFSARIEKAGATVLSLVASYHDIVVLVVPETVPRIVMHDADDDHVIAAALSAGADFIVTGDRRHLLPLVSYRGIGILTPAEIVQSLGGHSAFSVTSDP